MNTNRKYAHAILWSVIVAVVLYLVLALVVDAPAVLSAFSRLSGLTWCLILSLSLTNYVFRFVRWQVYLVQLGYRIPVGLSGAYYLSGFAFTTTPGKVGEAMRSLFLKRHGMGYVDSISAFFSERFVDVVSMLLLALAATQVFTETRWPILILFMIVLFCLPLIHNSRLHTFLISKLDNFKAGKLKQLISHALQLMKSSSLLLKPISLLRGLLLGVLAWGSEGIAFYLIADQLGIQLSLLLAVSIYAVSSLIGAISFLPGGLGGVEAAMATLLILTGASPVNAVAVTMICRVTTLWFAVTLGLGMLLWVESHNKGRQDERNINKREPGKQ